jgi:hypothetical protein
MRSPSRAIRARESEPNMDQLIELIVRALIELFSSRRSDPPKKQPPKKQPPRTVRPGSPVRRAQARSPELPIRRQQEILQELMLLDPPPRFPKNRKGPPAAPPPRVVKPVSPPATVPRAAIPPPVSPRIASTAIAQLIASRPTALRTAYVLSEIIQPPLALRNAERFS